jgi:hypothetical protein
VGSCGFDDGHLSSADFDVTAAPRSARF